jgi:hypothetical protein
MVVQAEAMAEALELPLPTQEDSAEEEEAAASMVLEAMAEMEETVLLPQAVLESLEGAQLPIQELAEEAAAAEVWEAHRAALEPTAAQAEAEVSSSTGGPKAKTVSF